MWWNNEEKHKKGSKRYNVKLTKNGRVVTGTLEQYTTFREAKEAASRYCLPKTRGAAVDVITYGTDKPIRRYYFESKKDR